MSLPYLSKILLIHDIAPVEAVSSTIRSRGAINPLSEDAVKLVVRRDAKRLIVRCSWRGDFNQYWSVT